MFFDTQILHHIYFRRLMASLIDFSIELGGGLLGGYFGAMIAALVIVLHEVPALETQKAVFSGMGFGFLFWGVTFSWLNRVLIQGVSRSSVGKKIMDLEIISEGASIHWGMMMQHWVSASLVGKLKVISSLDSQGLATIHSIQPKVDVIDSGSDKKAA